MDGVFRTRSFSRWMKKGGLTDTVLWEAVLEMRHGLVDADLGGGVVKKRVPLPGRGKRGGARALVATCWRGRWVFLFGFGKNDRDNIEGVELVALQLLSAKLLAYDDNQIAQALACGELMEVHGGHEEVQEPIDGRDPRDGGWVAFGWPHQQAAHAGIRCAVPLGRGAHGCERDSHPA
jgi:hypothetical protein